MNDKTKRALEIIMLNSGKNFKKIDKIYYKLSAEDCKLIRQELKKEYSYFDLIKWMNNNK